MATERTPYHNFHHHLLELCHSSIAYPESEGLWKCDACQRRFGDVGIATRLYRPPPSFYHCRLCNVDLCETCFNGKWTHSMHDRAAHELRPVDPRIEYRIHEQWKCDRCGTSYSHAGPMVVLFHCTACNFDLCSSCFAGDKHYSHKHPLVSIQSGELSKRLRCSKCATVLNDKGSLFRCYDSQCDFQLCNICYTAPAVVHPFHSHTLEASDPSQVYPQTGGSWHCNWCTSSSPTHTHKPLSQEDTMYHCNTCDYDLCEKCYSKHMP